MLAGVCWLTTISEIGFVGVGTVSSTRAFIFFIVWGFRCCFDELDKAELEATENEEDANEDEVYIPELQPRPFYVDVTFPHVDV